MLSMMRPFVSPGFVLLMVLGAAPAMAQDADPAAAQVAQQAEATKLVSSLSYKSDDFKIPAASATVHVGDGFQYLEAKDARRVLEEFWGNPSDASVLGMIVPKTPALDEDGSWAVVVTYSDEGHVDDEDTASADYTKMLAEMQESTRKDNKARKAQGYPPVDLVGWAAPPRYDQASKKIHWAKELSFDGSAEHTLNYDIRVLGREGYLSLNAVASMKDLAAVEAGMQKVLSFTEFDAGQRYADFNPETDKLAAYGVAALVAGGLASKAGLFAKLGVLLLAGKKLLIPIGIGIAALFSHYRKKKANEVSA